MSTPTVAEDVADRIRRLIHDGALSGGDRLPGERELAADLGVGRVWCGRGSGCSPAAVT